MVWVLFRVVVVLGAFLLFLIQPLLTKAALPLLGGSPGVWNAAMVFFQTILLLGYLYAHVLGSGKLGPRAGLVHGAILLAALAALKNPAMTAEETLKNVSAGFSGDGTLSGVAPLVTLVTFLSAQVGLPFLVLSSTSPLFQDVWARCPEKGGANPYSLSVLSNAGSLLALLVFPFLLEPAVGLASLFSAWNALFVVYAGLAALALFVTRSWPNSATQEPTSEERNEKGNKIGDGGVSKNGNIAEEFGDGSNENTGKTAFVPIGEENREKAGEKAFGNIGEEVGEKAPEKYGEEAKENHVRKISEETEGSRTVEYKDIRAVGPGAWVLFSFLPACLMQGVTFYLITEIASLPLLWVVPLALYLVTFMIAFSRRRSAGLWLGARGFALLLAPLAVLLTSEISQPRLVVMGVHVLAYFCGTLMCHCRLAESAPEYRRLTVFYVWMSLGGILGGAAHSLIAPFLWNGIYEYPLTLIAIAACLPKRPAEAGFERVWLRDLIAPAGVIVLCVCGFVGAARVSPGDPSLPLWVLKITGVSCFLLSAHPRRYALALGALFVMSSFVEGASGKDVWRERSFFGIHRVAVSRSFEARVLVHGSTLHGMQSLNPQVKNEPLLYYDRAGPAGSVFAGLRHAAASTPVTVGIVGLGAGSLFAYSQPGDHWTIFEIDPSVLRIAADPRFFSFLASSPASLTTRLGDARLRLTREPDGAYDLLVLDAYSSDAVPAHLLTREALFLYRQKIRPQGVLAFHLSNTFFTLEPIVAALAESLGLRLLIGESEGIEENRLLGAAPSTWGVVVPPDHTLIPWFKSRGWRECPPTPGTRLWTDDYSSLLPFLRGNPFWPGL